jgi:hypothetical protein
LKSLKSKVISYLESLRFPVLLLVAVVLFVVNIFVPDALPFVDEILLALVAAILARLKRRPGQTEPAPTPPDTREK